MKNLMFLILLLKFPLLSAQYSEVSQLHSLQLDSLLSMDDITLIDVRTQGEYANGHIRSSKQLNYYALDFKKNLMLLPEDQRIYLYCNTGYRSQRAADYLVRNGYSNVYNLEEGIMEWDLLDLAVVKDPNAKKDTKDKMEADEFWALVTSGDPVFIDFYAPWCGPCRMMMPMIDSLQLEYAGQLRIVKINVDASKRLVKELRISSVPYLSLYENGKVLFEQKGVISRNDFVALERLWK